MFLFRAIQYTSTITLGMVVLAGCPASAPPPNPSPTPAFTISWTGCSPWTPRRGNAAGNAEVQICATDYANGIGGNNAAPDGVIVARMINRGPGIEARWGLVPGVEYFIAVNRGGRYNIIEMGNAAPGAPRPNRTGTYHVCSGPTHTPQSAASAKFGTCASMVVHLPGSDAAKAARGPSGESHAVPTLNSFDGPAWITCDAGCCTTGLI